MHNWKIALPKGKGPARPSRGSHMCVEEGCSKYSVVGAVGDTTRCIAHGGGKRCQAQGCSKSAVAPRRLLKVAQLVEARWLGTAQGSGFMAQTQPRHEATVCRDEPHPSM